MKFLYSLLAKIINFIKKSREDKTNYWFFECYVCKNKTWGVVKPEVMKVNNGYNWWKKLVCGTCCKKVMKPEVYKKQKELESIFNMENKE